MPELRIVFTGLSFGEQPRWHEDRLWLLVVDGRANAYINGGGFNLMAGEEFRPGIIAMISADGAARRVADGLSFPNGMHVMPDGRTLIVAESYANSAHGIRDRSRREPVGPEGLGGTRRRRPRRHLRRRRQRRLVLRCP